MSEPAVRPQELRLPLVEGRPEVVAIALLADGSFLVRDPTGAEVQVSGEELAEAVEAMTGVHHGRAERLAAAARSQTGT